MLPSAQDPILDAAFRLQSRPAPIAGDLRISYGVALVVLVLGACRAKRASLPKLHLLAHAARTKRGRSDLMEYVESPYKNTPPAIRYEPWLNRALAYAAALGFVTRVNGKTAALSPTGEDFLATLRQGDAVMKEEQVFAAVCAKAISEGDVKRLLSSRAQS